MKAQSTYRSYLFLALALLARTGTAQLPDLVFVSNDFENIGSGDVHIKWMTDSVFFEDGVNIFRQEVGATNWEKVNASPVRPAENSSSVSGLTQDETVYAALALDGSYSEFFGSPFRRAIIVNEALKSNVLAKALGITFKDESATSGRSYRYRISTAKGRTIATSEKILVENFRPITPPENLIVIRNRRDVAFQWYQDIRRFAMVMIQKSTDGQNFQNLFDNPLYIGKEPNEEGLMAFPEEKFLDTEIKKKEDYWYRVAGYDYFGNLGQYSAAIPATYADLDPPPAPQQLALTKSDQELSVSVTWEYPQGVEDLKGFMVLKQTGLEDTASLALENMLAPDLRSAKFLVDVPDDYLVTVVAVDNSDNTSAANFYGVKLADRKPPRVPSGFQAIVDSSVVQLSWNPNNEPDLMGYYVMRTLLEANEEPEFSAVGGLLTETSYSQDFPKVVDNQFVYALVAIDTNYNKSPMTDWVEISIKDRQPPIPPVITKSDNEEGKLILYWLASPDGDLSHYELLRTSARDTVSFRVEPSNSYSDDSVDGGTAYAYSMVAVDQSGHSSERSNVYSITSKGVATSELEGITPTNISAKYSKSKKRVSISWQQEFGASSLGVIVYKGEKRDELVPVTALAKKAGYVDKGVEEGHKYYYQLRTFTNSGVKHKTDIIEVSIKASRG